jgi:hypothetical protein
MSRCRVAAHNRSLHIGFGWVTPENQHQAGTTWWSSQEDLGLEATPSMRGLRRFTTKTSGYLVEPQNQDRSLRGRRRDPGAPRSFEAGDTWRDYGACVGRTRIAVKAWPPDENFQFLTIVRHGYPWVPTDQAHGRRRQVGSAY